MMLLLRIVYRAQYPGMPFYDSSIQFDMKTVEVEIPLEFAPHKNSNGDAIASPLLLNFDSLSKNRMNPAKRTYYGCTA